jgi:hypothetical protein
LGRLEVSVAGNSVVLRAGDREHDLVLSERDIGLLDGRFFAPVDAALARPLLGLTSAGFLKPQPLGEVLVRHKRAVLLSSLESLLAGFEDCCELLSYSYGYRFSGRAEASGGGGVSGFRVGGLCGFIDTRPSGYCDLTLSDVAPTGRGRVVEIIDMRVRMQIPTDDWGVLKLSRRRADVGWCTQLPAAIDWLRRDSNPDVEILHR